MKRKQQQRIIRFAAENYKNIKVVEFRMNRYITEVSGGNGAGKTSTLDGVFSTLAPRKTVNAEFLRRGQKEGKLEVETETHIITRTLDAQGGSLRIVAKATNTLEIDTDDWLGNLTGELEYTRCASCGSRATTSSTCSSRWCPRPRNWTNSSPERSRLSNHHHAQSGSQEAGSRERPSHLQPSTTGEANRH